MKTVLFVLILVPAMGWAQMIKITPEDTQRKHSYLFMRDGSVLRGQILRQDSSLITVRKKGGDLSFVEADQVVRISPNYTSTVPAPAVPQTNSPARYTVFVFRDGTKVEGQYVRRDSTMITVRKRNGQLTYFEPELLLRADTIRAETEPPTLPVVRNREFANRFSPWLLTGQTAFTAEKDRFYYRNTFLLLNEFAYGLTRNWSISASVNPFFRSLMPVNSAREILYGANVRFASKLTFPIGDQFRFGVYTMYQPQQKGYLFLVDQQWTLQGLVSFGNSQRSATLSYGMQLYPDSYSYSNKAPFVSAGIMHKLSPGLTFVSDNTFYLNPFLSATSAILSAALRFDRRRHAFDVGALASVRPYYYYMPGGNSASTKAYFAPYVGYNLLIGRD